MPKVIGTGGRVATGSQVSGGNEPPVTVDVTVTSPNPTREQIAEAFYARYGFGRGDLDFLKRQFDGIDPIAHSARSLRYDPGAVTTGAGGRTTLKIQVSAEDHQALSQLANKAGV